MKTPLSLEKEFKYWEITKDIVDQCIDIMLNLRQSGHPGGSRSKVHAMIVTLLSGAMRWDIRDVGKRFSDRFILVAGHCNPVVYATLAVLNEALRIKHRETGERKYKNNKGSNYQLVWEDLLTLRQNEGLPGHAEMEGKTLFFKANTGPSGHGSPFAAGAALALKFSGASDVKVFAFEGEGGFTTGASHETINSAWGLGLGNLVYFLDWNDFGIDSRPFSSIMYGGPREWFGSHGWHVEGAEDGEDWSQIVGAYYKLLVKEGNSNIPKIIYSKTRKGRGYHIYDSKSHGSPHKQNSELFWRTKKDFADIYNIEFDGFGDEAKPSWEGQVDQATALFENVFSIMGKNKDYVDYLSSRLIELGDSVPQNIETCKLSKDRAAIDKNFFDLKNLPNDIFASPGETRPNREGFSKFASYLNSSFLNKYKRPLVLAMSADLADSTNISGFSKGYGGVSDKGLYNKKDNQESPLFPQGITEFTNAGMMAGAATVNFSQNPYREFNGFFGAASTYGSFSYLKYGPLRLFSQLAQDSDLKVGKFIWVVGHSGPETAEDSRTHFGIFSTGVTQLFPEGHIINLHPWEYNEVAPALSAAMSTDVPLIAIHLTRPPIKIPDRNKLNMASHIDSSKGAYIIRDYNHKKEKEGLVIVRGTSSTDSTLKIIESLNDNGPNVKIVAAISWMLFQMQSKKYRESIIKEHEWSNSMIITNTSIKLMKNWIANNIVEEYSLSPDHDNKWRTGGSVDQIIKESKLDPKSVYNGIKKFAQEKSKRVELLKNSIII